LLKVRQALVNPRELFLDGGQPLINLVYLSLLRL